MDDWIYYLRLHLPESAPAMVTVGAAHPRYGWRAWDTTTYRPSNTTRQQLDIVGELWVASALMLERYTGEL